MANPIAYLRDNFQDNSKADCWSTVVTGSATIAETGGQIVCTLPSSTAGSHLAYLQSTGAYDLVGDGFYINIGTMVATGVAAQVTFDLVIDGSNLLRWRQLSNAITARTILAGVETQVYTATWSATTYKYLRIHESGGSAIFSSSTDGVTWTTRATVAGPLNLSNLVVQFGASCGNIASPGSFRVDDVNLILPAVTTNWHWTQVEWPLLYRFKAISIAANSGQGYIASSNDGTNWTYYSGPMGSASGGYNSLTLQATQAAAEAMAVNLPPDGRWDLPTIVECRFIRLYSRSITGSSYILREYYPRRLVQSDDIEAESIRAINIAAGAITADKIFVLQLSAITADMGTLTAGTITGGTIQTAATGARILMSAAANGGLIGYNGSDTYDPAAGTGTYQVRWLKTDGRLYAGGGNLTLDSTGLSLVGQDTTNSQVKWVDPTIGTFTTLVGAYASNACSLFLRCDGPDVSHPNASVITFLARNYVGSTLAAMTLDGANAALRINTGGLYVGTSIAPTVGGGQIETGGSVGFGVAVQGTIRVAIKGASATSSDYGIYAIDSASANTFYVRNDGAGFLKAAAWTYGSDAGSKTNIRAIAKDIRDFMLLEPKLFDYINGPTDRMGYLAQDVQAIIPSIVETLPDGTLGMRTDEIAVLTGHVLRRLIRLLIQKGVIGPGDIA